MINDPRGAFTCPSSTLTVLVNSDTFRGLLLTVLGSRNDFHSCGTPRYAYVSVINTRSFGLFWPISWTITHCFGVSERIPRLTNPGVRLRVGHQHSRFLSILVRFVHYYLPFWGPRAISTIDDPRGAFTCPSSTLTVLANLDPFRGLLLTFWGPRAISTIDDPRGAFTCPSSTLTVLANLDPFRGLLLTVLGSRNDFHSC